MLWVINVTHHAQTGVYSAQDLSVQITSGGIDGDSRFAWTNEYASNFGGV
ncbi:MAG TPA: hypothetical protein VGM01_15270 [Ktedonobacteraceae bacterium]